jgi:hypothetical protein
MRTAEIVPFRLADQAKYVDEVYIVIDHKYLLTACHQLLHTGRKPDLGYCGADGFATTESALPHVAPTPDFTQP